MTKTTYFSPIDLHISSPLTSHRFQDSAASGLTSWVNAVRIIDRSVTLEELRGTMNSRMKADTS